LFPYHLGVITSLEYHGRLDDSVHLAGASAGKYKVFANDNNVNTILRLTFFVCTKVLLLLPVMLLEHRPKER